MSTHNIFFYGELEKIIPDLSPNTPFEQFLCVSLRNSYLSSNNFLTEDQLIFSLRTSKSAISLCTPSHNYNIPPHDNGGVLWFHIGRPCVCLSISHTSVLFLFHMIT